MLANSTKTMGGEKMTDYKKLIAKVRATKGRTVKSTILSIQKAVEVLDRKGSTMTYANEVIADLRKKL